MTGKPHDSKEAARRAKLWNTKLNPSKVGWIAAYEAFKEHVRRLR